MKKLLPHLLLALLVVGCDNSTEPTSPHPLIGVWEYFSAEVVSFTIRDDGIALMEHTTWCEYTWSLDNDDIPQFTEVKCLIADGEITYPNRELVTHYYSLVEDTLKFMWHNANAGQTPSDTYGTWYRQ